MGIVLRQSSKYAFANLLGVLLGAFNILWLFPRYLSPQEIGILATLEGASVVGSIFAGLGVNVIADRFFPAHKDLACRHGGYLFFLCVYVLCAWTVFGIFFYVFYDFYLSFFNQKSPEVSAYFYWVFILAGFLAFQLTLESFARVYLRIAIPNFLREFVLRIFIMASVLAFAYHWIDYGQLVAIRVACYGLICLFLVVYLWWLGVPFWYVDRRFFTFKNILPLVRFGFFIFWGAVGITLVMKLDILMLGSMLNQKEVGIFTIAFFIGNVLEIPRKSIAQISQPLIAQAWEEKNHALIQKMYRQSSANSLIVGCWFFLGIWLNIDSLFGLIPNSVVYMAGKYVVLLVAITRLVDMGMGVNNEIITQSSYYIFNFISVFVLLFLVIGLNIVFIPIYGIVGAGLGSLVSILILNVIKFIFLYRYFGFQPFSIQHLKILFIFGLCFQIAWLPVWLPTWVDIGLRSVLITGAFWGLQLYMKTSEEFDILWKNVRQRVGKIYDF